MARFAEALNRTAEEIKRPPPPPVGHYVFRVTKYPDMPETKDYGQGPVAILTIPVAIVEPSDDVDMTDFVGEVAKMPNRKDFWFPEQDENRFAQSEANLKEFCEHCGVDVSEGTVQDWLRELPNSQFLGEVRHRPDKENPDIVYWEVRKTAPLS